VGSDVRRCRSPSIRGSGRDDHHRAGGVVRHLLADGPEEQATEAADSPTSDHDQVGALAAPSRTSAADPEARTRSTGTSVVSPSAVSTAWSRSWRAARAKPPRPCDDMHTSMPGPGLRSSRGDAVAVDDLGLIVGHAGMTIGDAGEVLRPRLLVVRRRLAGDAQRHAGAADQLERGPERPRMSVKGASTSSSRRLIRRYVSAGSSGRDGSPVDDSTQGLRRRRRAGGRMTPSPGFS
jgi:hypothetical protein